MENLAKKCFQICEELCPISMWVDFDDCSIYHNQSIDESSSQAIYRVHHIDGYCWDFIKERKENGELEYFFFEDYPAYTSSGIQVAFRKMKDLV